MCAGLMHQARVDRCVFGAPDPKGGAVGTLYDVSHDERLNHEFEVEGGVLEAECAEVLRVFFKRRRAEAKAAKLAARMAQEGTVGLPAGAEPPLLASECASQIDGLPA